MSTTQKQNDMYSEEIHAAGVVGTRSAEELEGVKGLGSGKTVYKNTYAPEVLETFPNKNPDVDYIITFDGYEGTSLCPRTGQPDFFKPVISYIPNDVCVESKSMKLYLFSFRETGSFHEDVCVTVGKDLVKLLHPKYLEVRMIYSPRGGLSIFPSFVYSDDSGKYDKLKEQRTLELLRDGSNRTVRYDM